MFQDVYQAAFNDEFNKMAQQNQDRSVMLPYVKGTAEGLKNAMTSDNKIDWGAKKRDRTSGSPYKLIEKVRKQLKKTSACKIHTSKSIKKKGVMSKYSGEASAYDFAFNDELGKIVDGSSCLNTGMKIRSNGHGMGMGTGKGKGPIGFPVKKKMKKENES